jgi:hypothetical protein
MPTWQHFCEFWHQSLSGGKKFIYNIYGNPNCARLDKLFFPNLYKLYNMSILMDFYLVPLREVCPRSSRPDGCSVKRLLDVSAMLLVEAQGGL